MPEKQKPQFSVQQLVNKLRLEKDSEEKRKIRAALRRQGHTGGLGGGKGSRSPKAKAKVKGKRSKSARAAQMPVAA